MSQIEKILNFIVEIEKLKNVYRKTRPVGLDRYENSAEHSWHVCLCALMLKDYSNDDINIDRVIKMLLIHDLGEIDCGDTIVYAAESADLKENEAIGVKRILKMLPDQQFKEYLALWHEFEAGESADSKFAKAIDRVPPLLHNLHDEGHSWKKHNVTKEQVFSVNSRIGEGSEELWGVIKRKLEEAVSSGTLK
ncbi:HD domain-containing protein [Thalassotalea litorea]|uniref:HD domain-containing protein n=1 Tax=Thalassotalea litorea TaxID=2020715 RepID=UPI0037366DC4